MVNATTSSPTVYPNPNRVFGTSPAKYFLRGATVSKPKPWSSSNCDGRFGDSRSKITATSLPFVSCSLKKDNRTDRGISTLGNNLAAVSGPTCSLNLSKAYRFGAHKCKVTFDTCKQ